MEEQVRKQKVLLSDKLKYWGHYEERSLGECNSGMAYPHRKAMNNPLERFVKMDLCKWICCKKGESVAER